MWSYDRTLSGAAGRADGCGGAAAHLPSATADEARQVAARGNFSREEKIAMGEYVIK